jgi:plasmid maintenance system killer protein
MEIDVTDKKLRSALDNEAQYVRMYGADMAKKLSLRLAVLRAADSLVVFWPPKSGPERCHELKGERAGTFSVDLKQPYRLLFRPKSVTHLPDRLDEQARWSTITAIEIFGIEDTHE